MPAMRRGRPALGKVGQRAGDAPRPRGRGSNRGWGADPLTPFPPWAGESESTRMEPQLTPPRCLLVPPTPHGPADPRGRGPTERTSRPSANRGPDRNPGLHCVVATPPLCPERSHPPRRVPPCTPRGSLWGPRCCVLTRWPPHVHAAHPARWALLTLLGAGPETPNSEARGRPGSWRGADTRNPGVRRGSVDTCQPPLLPPHPIPPTPGSRRRAGGWFPGRVGCFSL